MIPRLYVIADAEALAPVAVAEAVETMAEAGVRWVQIRAKQASSVEFFCMVEDACRRLEGSSTRLWIDDRVDLAALFPATGANGAPGVYGVHLGQRDLATAEARRLLGPRLQIGTSTHTRDQVAAAADAPEVDVVAVGPVFATTSKANPDPEVGLSLVRWARRRTTKPLVAIGGVDAERLPAVLAAGADAGVVLGAACRGSDLGAISQNCRRLLAAAA